MELLQLQFQASDVPEPLPLAQIFGYLLVAAVCHAQFHLSVKCWITDQRDILINIKQINK